MNDAATAKLKMLQASTRCLVFGLLGLVPVLGLPFALAALWISGRVRQQEKQRWNAARPYRLVGVACAALGAVLWTGILIIAVFRLIMLAQGLG
jgi:hypothetical protein